MKNKKSIFIGAFIVLFFLMIFLSQRWIEGHLLKESLETSPARISQISEKDISTTSKTSKYFRKVRQDPSREFFQSWLYEADNQIAIFKSTDHEIYDVQGRIPDARVEFKNETQNTHGVEEYRNGKRHGSYKEYYDNQRLKFQRQYIHGKLWQNKEYFYDGSLRMEEYYNDAITQTEMKEVGHGKIYYRDGTLMYEWLFTYAAQGGYNRSYDIKGKLMEENYFDAAGNLIRKESY